MIEALWAVAFGGNGDSGAGVAVLENGLIRGGDSTYFYIGDYSVKDGALRANISINHYAGARNNIFGDAAHYDVSLSGVIDHDRFLLKGESKPALIPVEVVLTRIAEISS